MGPPPDETVKINPATPPKPSRVADKRNGANAPRFKSIKDRS
jgi:hypothetical protein